ncbi:hypothetical protein [Pseudalkalibacillus sp. JSM 102089]|uniref:hypothetical protein n=1 Tax=Pseudalkalibacillus sp. JSM 102089 TaxID=3229856 RepID=UPI0035258B30
MLDETLESAYDQKCHLLTLEAMVFLENLQRHSQSIQQLIQEEVNRENFFEHKILLPETKSIREANWEVKPVRKDLQDRRVIVKQSVIDIENGSSTINAGANLLIADFSDEAMSFDQRMRAAQNLKELIQQERVKENVYPTAFMIAVNNRKNEDNYSGKEIPDNLIDFGLYVFHNTTELLKLGSAPYVCLKGVSSYREASYWNNIFSFTEKEMNLFQGTIKATVTIDQNNMNQSEEILYELRDHCAGLHFESEGVESINDLTRFVISVGHKRKTHVIVEDKIMKNNDRDDERNVNGEMFERWTREVIEGFDGKCITDTNLIPMMKAIWNHYMPEPNQIWKMRHEYSAFDSLNHSKVI